ncbi:hypothetical protein TIFTF001_019136 [Ficus carica]|uniref:Uncharacterized protein n=1 Tax=Ficus carica TaxID=3494 RepID=A0AA88AFH3_FICCA|nr:hypothetical protein TIFTF001_019136 [Ficus carica]
MDNTSGDKPNYMIKEIKMRPLRPRSHLAIKIITVEFKSIFSKAGSLMINQKAVSNSDSNKEI